MNKFESRCSGGRFLRDQREARIYDQHVDDLDIGTAVEKFCADLDDRGIDFTPPHDPFKDQAWSSLLAETYLLKAFL